MYPAELIDKLYLYKKHPHRIEQPNRLTFINYSKEKYIVMFLLNIDILCIFFHHWKPKIIGGLNQTEFPNIYIISSHKNRFEILNHFLERYTI